MGKKDYYETLNLKKNANESEIKSLTSESLRKYSITRNLKSILNQKS